MALEVSVPSWRVRGLPRPCAQASRQARRCEAHPVRARAAPRAPQRRTVSAGPVVARCPPFVPRRNWQPQCQVVAAAPGQCPTRKPRSAGRSRVKNRTSPAPREPRRPRRDSSSTEGHRRSPRPRPAPDTGPSGHRDRADAALGSHAWSYRTPPLPSTPRGERGPDPAGFRGPCLHGGPATFPHCQGSFSGFVPP